MLDNLKTVTRDPFLASLTTPADDRQGQPGNWRRGTRNAMTIVEVMVAVAVIVIAALGSLNYEYLCVDHVRIARAQLAATRIGQLLLEDWKSTGGSSEYDPEDLAIGFNPDTPWGDYKTVIDGLPFFIGLSQDDVDRDDVAGVTLRRIDVSVRWRKDFSYGSPDNDDPAVNLSTYVRLDQ